MVRLKKRGYIGVGMLLVFIAVILVAAVSASVLLRTGRSLENRALATGNAAKDSISTGIELMSIIGHTNTTANTIVGFDVTVRVLSSSRGIKTEEMTMAFTSVRGRLTSKPQSSENFDVTTDVFTQIDETNPFNDSYVGTLSTTTVSNLERQDTRSDQFGFTTAFSPTGNAALLFLRSTQFYSGGSWNFSSVRDVTDSGAVVPVNGLVNYANVTIYDNSTDEVLGFVRELYDNPGYVGGGYDLTITSEIDVPNCDWDMLLRNNRFCLMEQVGDGDAFMDEEELWILRYRVQDPLYAVPEDSEAEFRILVGSGLSAVQRVLIPPVVGKSIVVLYP